MNHHATLKAALAFAAKKDVRYYLEGVHIWRDSPELVIEGSDGYRAIIIRCNDRDIYSKFPEDLDVIISRDSLTKALKLGPAELEFNEGVLTYGGFPLELVDGRYPQMVRVLNGAEAEEKTDRIKGVDTALMAGYCKAVADLMKSHKEKHTAVEMLQNGASQAVVWSGKLEDHVMKFKALLMPCRV